MPPILSGWSRSSSPTRLRAAKVWTGLLIGEDVSERLDVTPAKFRVIVTRRPKYAYRTLDGVFQSPKAPSSGRQADRAWRKPRSDHDRQAAGPGVLSR
ncbi:hypothetical protein EOA85_31275 [Mesorhizobium sp. M5C.F.Ca.IN.020.29.1.1]|nr:hypothetical protein EOA85_31275 [Mesorhizobium sp. M5C.F.Ca.IN.020.29.1.1]